MNNMCRNTSGWLCRNASTYFVVRVFWLFLCAGVISSVSADEPRADEVKIGLALGAGGANGLAHIAVLEVFDELQITPHRIAGSSIGAIMGALYASGHSAAEIKELAAAMVGSQDEAEDPQILNRDFTSLRWIRLLELEFGDGGLLKGSGFISFLRRKVKHETFAELEIPLYVVAADLWTCDQVVFTEGEIYPALEASMAVPGLFAPVHIGGRILVDGATVNPVPYDLLFDECDLVVAINVFGKTDPQTDPSALNNLFTSARIMQTAILNEKMKHRQPHIFIETDHEKVNVLAFHEFQSIYEQSLPAKETLITRLRELLQ